MSIINQALKKAQRERLLREPRTVPYLRHRDPDRRSRRRFRLVSGCVIILSLTATVYVWLPTRAQHPTRPPEPQPALQTATTSTPDKRPGLRPRTQSAATRTPTALERHTAPAVPLPQALPSRPPRPAVATTASGAEAAVPALQDRVQAQTLFDQAVAAQKAGEFKQMQTLLQRAIELDPTLTVAYNILGNLYYQQQQYHQALAMYQQALHLDPDYATARNNLGSTYLQLAMDKQALEELRKAVQSDSAYGLAYYNLACVYARAGDSTTTAQYLRRAITIEPQARTWAQTDEDFSRVRTAPEVLKLLGSS